MRSMRPAASCHYIVSSALTAAVLLTLAPTRAYSQESEFPVVELTAEQKQEAEKFLGAGVVGKALPSQPIDDPVRFLSPKDATHVTTKITYGKRSGETGKATLTRLDRQDGKAWRMDGEHEAWYGEITADGSVVLSTTYQRDQGVMSRYSPPEPVLATGIKAGESHTTNIAVTVFDLAKPDKQLYSGKMETTYTYVGMYEVTVPAGTFDAALFEWHYKGKVGPANVDDLQYWFFAKDIGPIARIDRRDVSAVLVYREKTRIASVLVDRQ